MSTSTWVDKSSWGEGPWQEEPDKINWTDAGTALPCMIVRGPSGALCGYVGVPPGHPLHGVEYENFDVDVYAHGGITFTGECQEGEHGICHVPEPGEPEDVWWIGFDCAHGFDVMPAIDADLRRVGYVGSSRHSLATAYKDVAYVTDQVRDLAQRLVEMGDDQEGI